jgi:hypothetical protein
MVFFHINIKNKKIFFYMNQKIFINWFYQKFFDILLLIIFLNLIKSILFDFKKKKFSY